MIGSVDRPFLQLVFGSRLLLVVILSITKISTISLIREIFTRSATKWWFRVIAAAAIVQALAGCLIISVNCSPTATLDGAANDRCPGNVRIHLLISVDFLVRQSLSLSPLTYSSRCHAGSLSPRSRPRWRYLWSFQLP